MENSRKNRRTNGNPADILSCHPAHLPPDILYKDDSKPRSDWKLNEEWAWFIGNNRERLKLTTKPEPYSFQRTLNWLSHQVAPTLKVAIKLDEINQTQVVKDILDHAKLTDRHKQILKQQSVKEQDVITTKK